MINKMKSNKIKLRIEKVADVYKFIELTSSLLCNTRAIRNTSNVDAKSILGVLSINPDIWFYLVFDEFVDDKILDQFKEWEVE